MSYVESAKTKLIDFVESASRFDQGEILISNEESFVTKFTVKVVHQGSFRAREGWIAGNPEARKSDLIAKSRGEYGSLTRTLMKDAERHVGILNSLLAEITAKPYAQYPDQREYKDFPITVFYTCTCHTCDGKGELDCSFCKGSGRDSCSCCCDNDCIWCNGSGSVDCSHCHGHGADTCYTCLGSGDVTEFTTPIFVITPVFEIEESSHEDFNVIHALSSFSQLSHIEDGLAELQRRTFEIAEDCLSVIEHAVFICPFLQANVCVNNVSAFVVVFGKRPAVSNAGGLVEHIVRPDLDLLKNELTDLAWYDFDAIWDSQDIAKLVMSSEIHRSAVEMSVTDNNSNFHEISVKLSKALSPSYIQELDEVMRLLLFWTLRSNKLLAWVGAIAVTMPMAAYLYSEGRYFWSAAVLGSTFFVAKLIARQLNLYRFRWINMI